MSSKEEQSLPGFERPYFAWLESEEGLELRSVFPGLQREDMSVEAWSRLHIAYERLTGIVALLFEDRERMRAQGRTVEGGLSFLNVYLTDLTSFYRMLSSDLGPTEDDDFPF